MSATTAEVPSTRPSDDIGELPTTQRLLTRLMHRPLGVVSLAILVLLVVSAIFAPLIAPHSPDAISVIDRFHGPSSAHWFGTDELGRDLLSRLLFGGRIALGISFGAAAISTVLGVLWGFFAAQAGGLLDELLMRTVDVVMAIPVILFALVLVAAFGSDLPTLIVIIGLLLTPASARLARSAVLAEIRSDYYRAAVALGIPRVRILFGELLPNAAPVIIARTALAAADAMIIEASLSFIGLGVPPPSASWGTLVKDGYSQIFHALYYVIFPAAVILLAIWALNTLGDQLQELLDPRTSR
ncbi:MAG: ABC transporter permease [Acidothermaceae bacterium]